MFDDDCVNVCVNDECLLSLKDQEFQIRGKLCNCIVIYSNN